MLLDFLQSGVGFRPHLAHPRCRAVLQFGMVCILPSSLGSTQRVALLPALDFVAGNLGLLLLELRVEFRDKQIGQQRVLFDAIADIDIPFLDVARNLRINRLAARFKVGTGVKLGCL